MHSQGLNSNESLPDELLIHENIGFVAKQQKLQSCAGKSGRNEAEVSSSGSEQQSHIKDATSDTNKSGRNIR